MSVVYFQNDAKVWEHILKECLTNQMDCVSLVCRDGEQVSVSCLLLATVSPYLAQIFKSVDIEECVIHLPDIDRKHIFTLLSSFTNINEIVKFPKVFDGVLWKECSNDVKDEATEGFEDLLFTEDNIKIEDEEVYDNEDNVESIQDDFFEEKVKTERSPDNTNTLRSGRKRKFKEAPKKKIKEDSDSDYEVPKVKKKRRGKAAEEKEVLKMKLKSQLRKSQRKKQIYFKGNTCTDLSEYYQDVDLKTAQDSLKAMLQDENNLEDPVKLWFQYHGLNSSIYNITSQLKYIPFICPVCDALIDNKPSDKGFYSHLRRHKCSNYKCSCAIKKEESISDHLKLEHWKWEHCSRKDCDQVHDPKRSQLEHWNRKVGVKCPLCDKNFKKEVHYKWHMDNHVIKQLNCGCGIVFKNVQHKDFHMQVVHLKEKIGCSYTRCYYTCATEQELDLHVNIKHTKTVVDVEKVLNMKTAVCDLCGHKISSTNADQALRSHKISVHDTVLLQCQFCDKKFNALKMSVHIKTIHVERICNICGAKVKNLKVHVKTMHIADEQKKFKCDMCTKGFHERNRLENHKMNVHLKLRPYKCRYGCEFGYNDLSNRNAHERKKHGQVFQSLKLDPPKAEF